MPPEQPWLPDPLDLFDGAPCGLVVTTEDGTILIANHTFSTWIGYSQEALRGRRFQELLTMGGRIFHQTHWAPLMQMQGSVAEVKLELRHSDQHTVTTLLNGVRHSHANGVFYELAVFATADRDKYERELINARKVTEELLRAKTAAETALVQAQAELQLAYGKSQRRASFAEQMVAIVSHDLKNPLTAIKMASEMLARKGQDSKQTLMLSHITRSADRAQRMIADLLDLALARVGRGIAISPTEVDLHKVVTRSTEELRVAFPGAKLHTLFIGSGIANLDGDRVQQIIGNLVANSVAYGDLSRPITITSSLEDDVAMVSVHNHGPAIPESLRSVLFEPMTRGKDGDSDVRSVGLGLFIVREIAKAHGGGVVVSSNEEAGTIFSVHFPPSASQP
jgi:sigma-B regulation protein RsbU (phosphoserine phosphatase)